MLTRRPQDLREIGRADAARRGRRKDVRLKPGMSLSCEALEVRITPTTAVWTGVGADALWTNSANWAGNVAPVPGNDLVFPAGVTQLSPVNNFPDGTSFRSIEIDAAGYFLSNLNPATHIVVSSGIKASYATGNSSDAI